jgi:Spy/CpxP family protein refolding chaperone
MNIQKRTLSTIAATAIVLAVGISTAVAQGPGGRGPGQGRGFGPGPGGPGGGLPALRQLNLTEDQRAQVKAVLDEQRKQNDGSAVRKVGELQRALQAAVFADTPDTGQIDQLRAQIAEAEAAALAARVDVQLKIAQILTPEQRQQARESIGKRPGRGPGAHHH